MPFARCQSPTLGDLTFDDLDRRDLLFGVAPIDVKTGLDAWREEQRDPSLSADLFLAAPGQVLHEAYDASCGMTEEVDRVFNIHTRLLTGERYDCNRIVGRRPERLLTALRCIKKLLIIAWFAFTQERRARFRFWRRKAWGFESLLVRVMSVSRADGDPEQPLGLRCLAIRPHWRDAICFWRDAICLLGGF
jgi:hypothetical protein